MTETNKIRASLFAKDLDRMARFYADAVGLIRGGSDQYHVVLRQGEFELIVHQIPPHIADEIEISEPPAPREAGAVRLDFPVADVASSRLAARALGGEIDDSPPAWAEAGMNFYFGYDPEGNVFGVSQQQD